MLSEDKLQAIEARVSAATPGEWDAPLKDLGEIESFAAVDFYFDHSFEAYPPIGECGPVFVANGKENADFLANARTDVPALIAEVRRLQSEIANARLAALEEAAQIADDHFDPREYPYGTEIAGSIRALKTGVGLHASQQPHAVDLASAALRPNH